MILVMDVNSRMTGSWMGHEDDRVMDDRGQVHIEVSSGSDSDLMMDRLELRTQDLNGSPAQCASSRKAE